MTITVSNNQTIVFNAATDTDTSFDFSGEKSNIQLTNLSTTKPVNLTISGNFGINHSNVLTFLKSNGVSLSKSSVTYTKKTDISVITLKNSSGQTLGTITSSGDSYGIGAIYPDSSSASGSLQVVATTNSNNELTVCFLAGTLISTPTGDCPVESLTVGDTITAYVNGSPITHTVSWAGKAVCTVKSNHPDDLAGWPVRILKNALSDGVPYKDMLITSEHCLFLDGKFVPVRMLVNNQTIFYDKTISSYTYYHIETDDHSVIMADGALTESYLDTGNRHSFRSSGTVVTLGGHPSKTWGNAAAPLTVDRAFVEPLFEKFSLRAQLLGLEATDHLKNVTEDANIHLIADNGTVLYPTRTINNQYLFVIPSHIQSVRITSRASRPSDVIGPFVDDRRYLGVCIGTITLSENNTIIPVTTHISDEPLSGWNKDVENGERWTTGSALLPLPVRNPNSIAQLSLDVKATFSYLTDTKQEKLSASAS
ncbi:Hint domain-containing protein [Acetobacter indonesiensis]|uniref:Hedgehog/Intein (Hint) domain-containing protein n=1 Tax=Acetobacter indonesiensis TaxID=104101 RepID=A0A252AWW3_9PROT|nr:Hint domain-containing protein [Acetobacter indonesiensis]OUI95124.1 hypothetical protein HK17_00535 [Acetobacter indonesiensis]